MTPEERQRADDITASIAKAAKERRYGPIPGISCEEPKPSGKGFVYGALFCVVLAVHVAGYLAYSHFQKKADAEMAVVAAKAKDEREQLEEHRRLAREIQLEKERIASYAKQIAQAQTQAAAAPRKIEYNVVPEPPRPRQSYQAQQYVDPSPAPVAKPAFSKEQHAQFAVAQAKFYFNGAYAKKLGARHTTWTDITVDSITYDANWDKYTTEGKVNVQYQPTANSDYFKRSLKYEVVTHVRNGDLALETDVISK